MSAIYLISICFISHSLRLSIALALSTQSLLPFVYTNSESNEFPSLCQGSSIHERMMREGEIYRFHIQYLITGTGYRIYHHPPYKCNDAEWCAVRCVHSIVSVYKTQVDEKEWNRFGTVRRYNVHGT